MSSHIATQRSLRNSCPFGDGLSDLGQALVVDSSDVVIDRLHRLYPGPCLGGAQARRTAATPPILPRGICTLLIRQLPRIRRIRRIRQGVRRNQAATGNDLGKPRIFTLYGESSPQICVRLVGGSGSDPCERPQHWADSNERDHDESNVGIYPYFPAREKPPRRIIRSLCDDESLG